MFRHDRSCGHARPALPTTGDILSYHWSFGDGDTTDGGAIVTHIYTAAGTYTVTVDAVAADGEDAFASLTIVVSAEVAENPAGGENAVTAEPVPPADLAPAAAVMPTSSVTLAATATPEAAAMASPSSDTLSVVALGSMLVDMGQAAMQVTLTPAG